MDGRRAFRETPLHGPVAAPRDERYGGRGRSGGTRDDDWWCRATVIGRTCRRWAQGVSRNAPTRSASIPSATVHAPPWETVRLDTSANGRLNASRCDRDPHPHARPSSRRQRPHDRVGAFRETPCNRPSRSRRHRFTCPHRDRLRAEAILDDYLVHAQDVCSRALGRIPGGNCYLAGSYGLAAAEPTPDEVLNETPSMTKRVLASSGVALLVLVALIACGAQPDQVVSELAPTPTEPKPTVAPMPTVATEAPLESTSTPAKPIAPAEPTSAPRVASPFLNVIVPPCIPYAGSDVDPCERRATWDLENPFVEYDLFTPDVVPTIEESIMVLGTVSRSIDFIVRSIVIPGTTRCTEPEFRYRIWWLGRPPRQPAEPLLQCVTDIAVNEYIVGSGPSRLTVHARIPQVGCDSEDLACIGWAEREIGRRIEGNEWILLIGQPPDLGLSVWGITSYFMDVQRREDGTEVVTSWAKDFYDDAFYDNRDLWHVKSLNDSRLEMTLEEFKPVVKAAHQKYVEANGGRITTARDYLGREFPRLADDASAESLTAFFSQTYALDHLDLTPAPPPPVPGENDPNPDGLVINDIIATRVAGGEPIPGS